MNSPKSRFATHRIAEAIADEQPVDWMPAERALGADANELESLRLLDDVARAFRRSGSQLSGQRERPTLFRWGPLEVRERLGEGLTGEVYRAYDPALQREVALKLRASRDPLSDPANRQLLNEARQLARIRHRNVLAVFGADIHDGRAGIWSELIEGRTLAQTIADAGPLGPDETLAIGLDLCRALGVVHGAGLLHGDIKAENVMRERGGRLVLMDFGASGQSADLAGRALISGTRRYLAPEVLDGGAIGVASDLHALGVLLYHLLTGAFPREDDGSSVPLARRRADLSEGLVTAIESTLATEPKQRPVDAARFARTLAALRPDAVADDPRWYRRLLPIATTAAVVAAGLALFREQLWPPAWQIEARFVDSATGATLADGHPVRLGDTLALRLRGNGASHVYVLNEDADGELSVLFPLPGLDQSNPVPDDREIELPGTANGRALAWEISSPAASEEFVVIAADRPLPELTARLTQAANAAIADDSVSRGASRLRSAPQLVGVEGTQLIELIELARASAGDPDRLHVQTLRLPHVER